MLLLNRSHGDTYEVWPRMSAAEQNLANLKLPIDLDTSPSGIGPTNYGPRPLYPHMHLLPTYETLVVSTKCAPVASAGVLWLLPPVHITAPSMTLSKGYAHAGN